MTITATDTIIANATTLAGKQDAVQTVALANGGFVTAWNTDIGGQKDVMFQRFDADGNPVGGPVLANATVAGDQVLRDIAVTADGNVTLLWSTGKTVTARSFDSSGAPVSGEASILVQGPAATGAQLIAVSNNQYKVITTSNSGGNTFVEQATLNTAGGIDIAKSTISSATISGSVVTEVVDGNSAGTQFILLSSGKVMSSFDGSTANAGAGSDIIKLQDGFHVLADENLQNAMLTGIFGSGNTLTTYSSAAGQVAGTVVSDLAVQADTFDRVLVNLGGGRILVIWVSDTGTNFNDGSDPARVTDPDGIYAAVYDVGLGSFETDGLLIKDFGQGDAAAIANLQAINLEADLMSDGRVALTWSESNGLTGFDVFDTILDARKGALGTALDDKLIGTSGDDSMYGVAGNDRIVGLSGNDFLSGGTGDDAISGGSGDDVINGGDGRDFLYGNAGGDLISGGIGNDFIAGNDDDDRLDGNDGNDTINGGDGDDVIDGGAGNDVLQGGAGFNVIDGGSGSDALSFANQGGTYVDLDYLSDTVGNMDGFTADDDLIINVENVIGSSSDDYLAGSAVANVLRGNDGNDMFLGRGGADKFVGGGGGDTFIYEFASDGGDRIMDYAVGQDHIMIVSENFGDLNIGNILANFQSNSAGTASGTGPKLVLDNGGPGAGGLYYDADGGGAGVRVLLATITFASDQVLLPFTAADFVFV